MHQTHRTYVLVVAASLWMLGCVDTFAPREPYPYDFSLYGVLTPDRDTQSVWVFPIQEVPTLGSETELDHVTVTSTDLFTGAVQEWKHSAVLRENGQYEHLYEAAFRAAFDRTYRVEVRSNGLEKTAWADVRIPPMATARVVEAIGRTVTVDILSERANAMKIEVEYHVGIKGESASYFRQYWGSEQATPSGHQFNIDLVNDRYWVEVWYYSDFPGFGICPQLRLNEIRVHALVGDTTWDPHLAVFDPYVLSTQGTMDNVTNGTGFVGGGYRIDLRLDVPREAIEHACFIYCELPFQGCELPN